MIVSIAVWVGTQNPTRLALDVREFHASFTHPRANGEVEISSQSCSALMLYSIKRGGNELLYAAGALRAQKLHKTRTLI
jgi:hypothetical protein